MTYSLAEAKAAVAFDFDKLIGMSFHKRNSTNYPCIQHLIIIPKQDDNNDLPVKEVMESYKKNNFDNITALQEYEVHHNINVTVYEIWVVGENDQILLREKIDSYITVH